MSALLQANKLNIQIGDLKVTGELNLDICKGQCWAILGANGTGKTTLLHTLAGLRNPESGQLHLQAQSMSELSRRQVASQLGLLLQDSSDIFPSTVWDTVLTGRHPHLGRWSQENENDFAIARAALTQLDLADLAQRTTDTLSGGERRRLSIATLLAQQTPLLLLDEPTNHLDLRHQVAVLEHIRSLTQQGHAALMVLHDVNQAARYCDQVLMLFGDGQWAAGSSETLLEEARLSELYGHPLRRVSTENGGFYLPV
jgi:iron complex transport system ATP-binding protein